MPLESNEPVKQDTTRSSSAGQDFPEYTAEIRFGVVMYGGVSLAIYINGVTNEIFEMACATPRDGVAIGKMTEPSGVVEDETDEPSGHAGAKQYELCTRDIYRRLSWLVGNAELRRRYAVEIQAAAEAGVDDPQDAWARVDRSDFTQTRFAVDVVSGTSAGGINGLFLAKALANGEQFSPLKDLWINEGDFALLLNDEMSSANTDPKITVQPMPASLLNSDRMYAKLHYALGKMTPLEDVCKATGVVGTSPLADNVDLYITTTDIKGSLVPLRLFDRIVNERRFKQSYHFSYPNGITAPGNDFASANRSFMAFAARCTSSFPFAFEPMTLATLTRLKVAGDAPGVLRWNGFFPNLDRDEVASGGHVFRAFGDGGYLDNKPFSYVVGTLSRRFSSVPIERKLLYVEPAPEPLDPKAPGLRPDPETEPDPLQNSLAALTSIPQYETIREDLQAVLARNRRIERIERVVWLGERSVKLRDPFKIEPTAAGVVTEWAELPLSRMLEYYGTAFLSYLRLRVYSVTDTIAERLGARARIDGSSDEQYALRALVRVWRERNYRDEIEPGKQTINAFLDQFDIDYRLRRLGFLLRKVDKLTRLFHKQAAVALHPVALDAEAQPEFSDEELQLLALLAVPGGPFEDLVAPRSRDAILEGERILRLLKKGLLEARDLLLKANRDIDALPSPGQAGDEIPAELDAILLKILGHEVKDANAGIRTGVGGARTAVDVPPQVARMATASRTLQESVVFRAQAILAEADKMPDAPIRKWLLDGVGALTMKGNADAAGGRSTITPDAASCWAWQLLGSPKLAVVAAKGYAEIKVDTPASYNVVVDPGVATLAKEGLRSIDAAGLAALNTDRGHGLRAIFGEYYLRFDTYDQMSFPLYYDTETGEPSTVEVVRISPVDAINLIDESAGTRKKLAGTALANFGAFLDRRWRLNDIMWGQLDGAERLIEALLPMTDPDTRVVRKELIERAQRRILYKALVPNGHAKLTALVVDALDVTPQKGSTDAQLRRLFGQLWTGNSAARANMENVLVSLLTEPRLMAFVRSTREIDPKPDPEMTLRSAARAVTITGRVLQVISKKHGAGEVPSRWLARLGLLLQGIVAVSLPGTLNQRWWTHGMKVLYAFEAVLVGLALVFGSPDMRTLALTALASTFGLHLLSMVAGDLTRGKNGSEMFRVAMLVVLLTTFLLAGVGALTLVHQGVQQQLCWTRPGGTPSGGPASWACNGLDWFHGRWSAIWERGPKP